MAHASIDTDTARVLQVLVVDDSQALRTGVRSALEQAGLRVVGEAADGIQALTQAAAHRPDVVLMDLRMPQMDGIQATRILRRRQPDTPVVLWSGDDDARLDRAVRESGAQVGLPKGVDPAELVATLRGVCDAHDNGGVLAGRRASRADSPSEGLAASERAALEQLEAAGGYATRWPVGRRVTRSLASRQLVVVGSDYVLLTEAGRRALAGDSAAAVVRPRTGAEPATAPRLDRPRADRGSPGPRVGLAGGDGKWSLRAVASRSPRLLRS
jgi:DNA-binding NarL/FixJ family response regulator